MKNATTTYIILRGEHASQPAILTPSQEFLLPYSGMLTTFWWSLWVTTLVIIISRFIILPLLSKKWDRMDA